MEHWRGLASPVFASSSFEDDDRPALCRGAAAVWFGINPSQTDNGDHVLREGTGLVLKVTLPSRLPSGLRRGVSEGRMAVGATS
jgi:hypothetical protein